MTNPYVPDVEKQETRVRVGRAPLSDDEQRFFVQSEDINRVVDAARALGASVRVSWQIGVTNPRVYVTGAEGDRIDYERASSAPESLGAVLEPGTPEAANVWVSSLADTDLVADFEAALEPQEES